jgi:hypothetical protein
MPQPGSTPIILYNSSTASQVPLAADLSQGELAVNVTDKKIYSKNSLGAVVQMAAAPGANADITSLSGLTTPLSIAQGGTAATTAAGARTSLLAVGYTTTTGSAVLPASTTANRDGSPAAGYLRFNTTNTTFEGYNGTAWGSVGGGATGGGNDQVFQENQLIVTTNYTLSTGKSAISKGPITINSGVVVTIPANYSWLVL